MQRTDSDGSSSAALRVLSFCCVLATAPAIAANGQGSAASMSPDAARATVLRVLASPRCLNCHPTDDRPRQGNEQRVHGFGVERGSDDHGGPVQRCATCHRDENNRYSRVPGAPHWGLAPASMGWQGLSEEELMKRLLDPDQNGGRTPRQLVEHMSRDALVLWAWEPGLGRVPPPVPVDVFRAALEIWLADLESDTGGGR